MHRGKQREHGLERLGGGDIPECLHRGLGDAAKPEGGALTAAEEVRLAKLLKSGGNSA